MASGSGQRRELCPEQCTILGGRHTTGGYNGRRNLRAAPGATSPVRGGSPCPGMALALRQRDVRIVSELTLPGTKVATIVIPGTNGVSPPSPRSPRLDESSANGPDDDGGDVMLRRAPGTTIPAGIVISVAPRAPTQRRFHRAAKTSSVQSGSRRRLPLQQSLTARYSAPDLAPTRDQLPAPHCSCTAPTLRRAHTTPASCRWNPETVTSTRRPISGRRPCESLSGYRLGPFGRSCPLPDMAWAANAHRLRCFHHRTGSPSPRPGFKRLATSGTRAMRDRVPDEAMSGPLRRCHLTTQESQLYWKCCCLSTPLSASLHFLPRVKTYESARKAVDSGFDDLGRRS